MLKVHYVFEIICLMQRKALFCYVLVYERRSQGEGYWYQSLDTLKCKTIPYDINRVRRRDVQDPMKSRVLWLINNGPLLLLVYEKSKRTARTVASARRSGQEDFQRGTPPVSLASCSISPFLTACIITEWSSKDRETDSTGTSILIPLLLLNFNMRIHGNPTAWYLFLATAPPKLV